MLGNAVQCGTVTRDDACNTRIRHASTLTGLKNELRRIANAVGFFASWTGANCVSGLHSLGCAVPQTMPHVHCCAESSVIQPCTHKHTPGLHKIHKACFVRDFCNICSSTCICWPYCIISAHDLTSVCPFSLQCEQAANLTAVASTVVPATVNESWRRLHNDPLFAVRSLSCFCSLRSSVIRMSCNNPSCTSWPWVSEEAGKNTCVGAAFFQARSAM